MIYIYFSFLLAMKCDLDVFLWDKDKDVDLTKKAQLKIHTHSEKNMTCLDEHAQPCERGQWGHWCCQTHLSVSDCISADLWRRFSWSNISYKHSFPRSVARQPEACWAEFVPWRWELQRSTHFHAFLSGFNAFVLFLDKTVSLTVFTMLHNADQLGGPNEREFGQFMLFLWSFAQ